MTTRGMRETTHECPAPGCAERVPFERFACRSHWYAIPGPLRLELTRAWRDLPGTTRYFKIRARCLRALGVAEADVAEANGGIS